MPRGTTHDVVVVGGRIAGALTAALLASRGHTVLVLEARRFPADTISTHFFRGDGLVRVLDEAGALPAVLGTGAPRLTREYFHLPGSAPEENPPQEPGDAGFCLSVRRLTLDDVLATYVAGLPGVDFRTGVRAVGLLHSGAVVAGVRDADGVEHWADLVVGADGARSRIAAWVGALDERREPPARVLYYRYVSGWESLHGGPHDAPEFSLNGDELAYAFPSDGELTCMALSIPVATFADVRHDAANFFDARLRRHGAFADRMSRTTRAGRLFAGPPTDSYVRQAAGAGWALVGDAGTHQDPWSGEGMDTAARQAAALARTWRRGDGPDGWVDDYPRARDSVTLDTFEETTRLAADLRQLLAR
jgi:flavin-dependent dehydrogenase